MSHEDLPSIDALRKAIELRPGVGWVWISSGKWIAEIVPMWKVDVRYRRTCKRRWVVWALHHGSWPTSSVLLIDRKKRETDPLNLRLK